MPESVQPGARWGEYTLLGLLGSGGMGAVYQAQDPAGRHVALKILSERPGHAAQERFQREARITASLEHPGIVRVHSAGDCEGQLYIVYELVEGQTLEARLPELERDRALRIVLEVARAVGFAHQAGVIHRDIKPENILIDGEGRAKVADFGLALAGDLERLTRTGAIVGTPFAMAPEQIAGQRASQGPATDVWALGVLLYYVLVGRPPFEAPSLGQLAVRIVSGVYDSPRDVDPTISCGLEEVCLRALSGRPEDRFSDGGAFAEALEATLGSASARPRALARFALRALLGCAAVAALALSWPDRARDPSPSATPQVASSATPQADLLQLELAADRAIAALGSGSLAAALEELSQVHASASARLPPHLSDRLADAVFTRATLELDVDPQGAVALCDALFRTGVEPAPRLAGSTLVETALAKHDFDSLEGRLYAQLVVSVARLDQTLGLVAVVPLTSLPRMAAVDSERGRWFRFLALRGRLNSKRLTARALARDDVLEALRSEEDLLGSTCWADAAADIARQLLGAEGLALLAEAERKDPRNPALFFARAELLEVLDPERACQAAERAIELYSERSDPLLSFTNYRRQLEVLLRLQLETNRRSQAKQTWAKVAQVFPARAERLLAEHPWLGE